MLKKILNSKRGEMYVEALITFIIILALLLFCLSALRVSSVKNSVDVIADRLLETATANGSFGTEFEEELAYLQEAYSALGFEVTYEGDWYNSSLKRVQLGDRMTVVVTVDFSFGGFGSFLTIPLSTIRSGASENYWKSD